MTISSRAVREVLSGLSKVVLTERRDAHAALSFEGGLPSDALDETRKRFDSPSRRYGQEASTSAKVRIVLGRPR